MSRDGLSATARRRCEGARRARRSITARRVPHGRRAIPSEITRSLALLPGNDFSLAPRAGPAFHLLYGNWIGLSLAVRARAPLFAERRARRPMRASCVTTRTRLFAVAEKSLFIYAIGSHGTSAQTFPPFMISNVTSLLSTRLLLAGRASRYAENGNVFARTVPRVIVGHCSPVGAAGVR